MKSIEYIKDALTRISKKFPQLSIKYQFYSDSLTHIVEVKPISDFEDNSEYISCEADLSITFDHDFFPESILFVSEESLTKIDCPSFIIEPKSIPFENKCINPTFKFEGICDMVGSNNDFQYRLAA